MKEMSLKEFTEDMHRLVDEFAVAWAASYVKSPADFPLKLDEHAWAEQFDICQMGREALCAYFRLNQ